MSFPPERPAHSDPHVPTGEWEAYEEESAEALLPQVQDPVFPVTLRGYDRATVDAYVEDVTRLLGEIDATRSPKHAVERALDRVGEETSGILQRARETAEEITRKSRAQSDDRLQTADREARAMRQQAEARVRQLDEDTERLWEERNRLLEDITSLSRQLGGVVEAANRRYPLIEAAPGPGADAPDEHDAPAGMGATESEEEDPPPLGGSETGADDPAAERAAIAALTTDEYVIPDEELEDEPDDAWEGDRDDDVVGEADETLEDDRDELEPERLDHEERAAEVEPYPAEVPPRSPRFAPRDRYTSPRPLHQVRRASSSRPEPERRAPLFERMLSLRPAGRP